MINPCTCCRPSFLLGVRDKWWSFNERHRVPGSFEIWRAGILREASNASKELPPIKCTMQSNCPCYDRCRRPASQLGARWARRPAYNQKAQPSTRTLQQLKVTRPRTRVFAFPLPSSSTNFTEGVGNLESCLSCAGHCLHSRDCRSRLWASNQSSMRSLGIKHSSSWKKSWTCQERSETSSEWASGPGARKSSSRGCHPLAPKRTGRVSCAQKELCCFCELGQISRCTLLWCLSVRRCSFLHLRHRRDDASEWFCDELSAVDV